MFSVCVAATLAVQSGEQLLRCPAEHPVESQALTRVAVINSILFHFMNEDKTRIRPQHFKAGSTYFILNSKPNFTSLQICLIIRISSSISIIQLH